MIKNKYGKPVEKKWQIHALWLVVSDFMLQTVNDVKESVRRNVWEGRSPAR